jgi:Pyruvate/2-oxoacid:ferredoxin oxidoreductase delta subunit
MEKRSEIKCLDITQKDACCGCGACLSACPQSCIIMTRDEEGFDYPVVERAHCTQCGRCRDVCPILNVPDKKDFYERPAAYAAWNLDEYVRRASTSGGVFSVLAEYVLAKKGVIFGAAFEDDFRSVRHIAVESSNELDKLRGSKYVQSSTIGVFGKIRTFLAAGREVLFTGTPCQVAAVRNFIGPNTAGLTTCDLVCHGVPSPGVFEKYIDEQSQAFQSSTAHYVFRGKEQGWNFPMVQQVFKNGRVYKSWNWGDPFMHGFLKDIILRPICYRCEFPSFPRVADITLADYWGVATKYPKYDDNRGTSLVLVNSAVGDLLLKTCATRLFLADVDLDHAVSHNSHLYRPAHMPEIRKCFFEASNKNTFGKASRSYIKNGTLLKRACTRTIRQILRKVRFFVRCQL